MSVIKKYYLLKTIYSFALSFTKTTFVIFFLDYKMTHAEIGLIFGLFNITSIIFEPLTAILVSWWGERNAMLAGSVLKVVAAILFFFGDTFSVFLFAEFISAIAFTFISGTMTAWLVNNYSKEDTSLKLYEIFAQVKKYKYSALLLGGFAGAVVGDYSLSIPWAMNAVVFSILIFFILRLMERSQTIDQRMWPLELKESLSAYTKLLKDKSLSLLMFSSFLSAFSLASVKLFWLPTVKVNLDTTMVFLGFIWIGIAGAKFLGSYFVTYFMKKFNYKLESLISFNWLSSLFLFLMIFTINSPFTILFYLLFEFGKPLYSSVKGDLINYQTDDKSRVTILSLHSLMIKLGTSLGLASIGLISQEIGIQNAWYLSAFLFMLNFILYKIIKFLMLENPAKKEILYT